MTELVDDGYVRPRFVRRIRKAWQEAEEKGENPAAAVYESIRPFLSHEQVSVHPDYKAMYEDVLAKYRALLATPAEQRAPKQSSCDRHAETMPHFTLLAQDNLAVGLVREWLNLAAQAGAPRAKLEQASLTLARMGVWRSDNPDRCKNPD